MERMKSMNRNNSKSKKGTKKKKMEEPIVGSIVCHKYLLTKFINQGSFGKIYVAKNTLTNVEYAAKIEKVYKNETNEFYETLLKEAKILYELNGKKGFPKMIYLLKEGGYTCMIMTLLGENIEDLFNLCKKKFQLVTIVKLAIDMIELLRRFHQEGYIHRDIKPENFMFGKANNEDDLFLIDFGLSKKYLNEDGTHIRQNKNSTMIGTIRFTSINSHLGYEHCRKDDLESLGYVFVFLFNGGVLPWMNQNQITNKVDRHNRIAQIKMNIPNDVLFQGLPNEFLQYMIYIKGLKFEDEPNYDFLIDLFTKLYNKDFSKKKFVFDWKKLNNYEENITLIRKNTIEKNSKKLFNFKEKKIEGKSPRCKNEDEEENNKSQHSDNSLFVDHIDAEEKIELYRFAEKLKNTIEEEQKNERNEKQLDFEKKKTTFVGTTTQTQTDSKTLNKITSNEYEKRKSEDLSERQINEYLSSEISLLMSMKSLETLKTTFFCD